MSLKISKDLTLPIDAITQTFSILAQRRVGKTYTASVMAEEFVANSLPFVALDPTGAWWGLRSSADGKSEGLPVVIIGGEHGDVPLEFTAGKVIADLVVDHPNYYVIDLSGTESNAEQDRFAADFAERLYRRKATIRTPLHLFVDEADAFAPQRPLDGQQRMLGAFETLVRRGGIRGIGTTLITQRAAVLNKNVLTQTDSLFVLRMNSSQDQDAMEDWVKRNGTKEQKEAMMSSLASLPTGESWFWSPGWMQVFKKVHIRLRRTFNSSATPKAGEKIIIPQKLASVDLERLGNEIKSTIERANENDPGSLKKRVASLQDKVRELDRKLEAVNKKPEKVTEKIKTVNVPVIQEQHRGLIRKLATSIENLALPLEGVRVMLACVPGMTKEILTKVDSFKPVVTAPVPLPKPPERKALPPAPRPQPRPETTEQLEGDFRPSKCQKALMGVLSQFPEGCRVGKLALLAGYKQGGTLRKELAGLRSSRCITGANTETMVITEHGNTFGPFTTLPTGDERIKFWKNHPAFGKQHREFITALVGVENGYTVDELCAATETPYTPGGTTRKILSNLRTAGVIVGKNTERMKLNPELFA